MYHRPRKDHKDVMFPGGIKQTGPAGVSAEARQAMIERQTQEPADRKPESAADIIAMFRAGRLTPERALELFLELEDKGEISEREMVAILTGRADSASARQRMIKRKGIRR